MKKHPNPLNTAVYIFNRIAQHRNSRLLFNSISAILFAVLIIGLLPAAVQDPLVDAANPVGNMFAARETLTVGVYYPEDDMWGSEQAEYLAEQMSQFDNIELMVIPVAADGTEKTDTYSDFGLRISVGYTARQSETYFDAYSRLGGDGMEISRSDNSGGGSDGTEIYITAFDGGRVRDGIDRFLRYFRSSGKLVRIDSKMYVTETGDTSGAAGGYYAIQMQLPEGSTRFKVLTLSEPDADEYSLRALKLLLEAETPSLVVFNGGLDCGASDRASLAAAWAQIAGVLDGAGVQWCINLGENDSGEMRILECEVITEQPGCITPPGICTASVLSSTGTIIINNSDGTEAGALFLVDCGDTRLYSSGCDMITGMSELLVRSSGSTVSDGFVTISSCTLPQLADALNNTAADYPDIVAYTSFTAPGAEGSGDIFDASLAAGTTNFICGSGTTSTGTASVPCVGVENGLTVGLCGSLGFDSPGLGGRFDLNNSLRGGILLTLEIRRAGYSVTDMKYLYAALLGANVK